MAVYGANFVKSKEICITQKIKDYDSHQFKRKQNRIDIGIVCGKNRPPVAHIEGDSVW